MLNWIESILTKSIRLIANYCDWWLYRRGFKERRWSRKQMEMMDEREYRIFMNCVARCNFRYYGIEPRRELQVYEDPVSEHLIVRWK